jgi:hypothetical protein
MRVALYATIWVALALLVVSEVARRFEVRLKPDATYKWAWWAFAAGGALTAVHVLIALAIQYNWDHKAAVSATAAQAAEVYGFRWRGNIYVSYLFVAIWVLEAVRWRLNPELFTTRRPGATWALRFFFLLIIVNGAVIFASYPMRLLGAVIVAALVWAWLPGASRRSTQKAQSPQRLSF